MSSGSDFIVEAILNKRVKSNQIEYLIKWEGYSIEEATWEPVRNLNNVKDMIRRFESMKEGSIKNNMLNNKRQLSSRKVNEKERKRKESSSCSESSRSKSKSKSEEDEDEDEEDDKESEEETEKEQKNQNKTQFKKGISIKKEEKSKQNDNKKENPKSYTPNRIVKVRIINTNKKEFNCLIEWKLSSSIMNEKDKFIYTWESSEEFKNVYPLFLCNYLIDNINFRKVTEGL